MATVLQKKRKLPPVQRYGPEANGILLTPAEFDRADFEEGWRYELINGVLVVSPLPSESEVDPNEELGYLLRAYRETHPEGSALDATLPERIVRTGRNRRRADRLIWAGLGRLPRRHELPTILAEFVSGRKRDQIRDYETKRDEYLAIKVEEYWVIDRFRRTMTVFTGKGRKRVVREDQVYSTPLLPGFELPLARLFRLADRWPSEEAPAD
jgi:Uma2 family endonuclease